MLTFIYDNTDLKVIVSSLSGAMVCILTQQRFSRSQRPVAFFVSFVMGIVGADTTLEIIGIFVPGAFSGEGAVGAFVCSALVITVMINITARMDFAMKKGTKNNSTRYKRYKNRCSLTIQSGPGILAVLIVLNNIVGLHQ
ncbi:putative holin [Enterobacter asburiae]|uniref:putative holin n=1 Tax=Enterobacter asburiae TaxID=61645 RepID=UPI0011D26A86|nr:putative holin [Enterobacter asburiae]